MVKVTEALRGQCKEKQREYEDKIESLEKRIIDIEKKIKDSEEANLDQKIDIAFMSLIQASYHYAINSVSYGTLAIKMEGELNEARKLVSKVIVLCEDVYGNATDESLSYNEEVHEALEGKFDDKWKYNFICSLGYMIDYVKYFYGENSKWKWNFVELEGRFALLTKNMINFKSFIRLLEPGAVGYVERSNHMKLTKRLLAESSEQYRKRYELKDKNVEDMRFAINLSDALRVIHAYLGEADQSSEQKKVRDLWKKKLNEDIKKQEKI